MPDATVVDSSVCGSARAAEAEPTLPSQLLTRLAGLTALEQVKPPGFAGSRSPSRPFPMC